MTDRPHARACIFMKERAEEAARFYAATIPDSRVEHVAAAGEGTTIVLFTLLGSPFMAMDGNPDFQSRPDCSIAVPTQDQEETDRIWAALSDGGTEGPCGWLSDRFGVHWQITPRALVDMLSAEDRQAAGRAHAAMMGMKKIDIAAIEAAFGAPT